LREAASAKAGETETNTNSEIQISKRSVQGFGHWIFESVSDFDIRVSGLAG
jgi:hypothetical protein